MDTTELMARIKARLKAVGLSARAACLRAGPPVKVDSIRSIGRGHPPRRVILRKLAAVLECELEYLEEVAPDLRLDARADELREAWNDIFDEIPSPARPGYIEGTRTLVRATTPQVELAPSSQACRPSTPEKKGAMIIRFRPKNRPRPRE